MKRLLLSLPALFLVAACDPAVEPCACNCEWPGSVFDTGPPGDTEVPDDTEMPDDTNDTDDSPPDTGPPPETGLPEASCGEVCGQLDNCGLIDGSYDWGSDTAQCQDWCMNEFGGDQPSEQFLDCAEEGFNSCDGDAIEDCL